MLKKLLLSVSIFGISVIAVDNAEPDWKNASVWPISEKIDRENIKPYYNDHNPLTLEKSNTHALLEFFDECKKIEIAKDTKDQLKIEKAIKNFKLQMRGICGSYEYFSGKLRPLSGGKTGEIDLSHIILGHMERGLQKYPQKNSHLNNTINTVINEVAKPNLAVLSNVWVYGEGSKTYDDYILSPITKKYKLQIIYIKDSGGKEHTALFIVLQDKEELKL